MPIEPAILKYKTADIRLNQILETYRDKINRILTRAVNNLQLYDTGEDNYLTIKWDEDDTLDRELGLKVNSGDRIISLAGNITIVGNLVTIGANKVASWEATTGVKTPEIYSASDLKIEPDVQGDVILFGDTDVGDATDGKSLYVYRKAAEFDKYWRFYVDQYGSAIADVQQSGGTNPHNLFIGQDAGAAITTGVRDIAIGDEALYTYTAGRDNVAIGYRAMKGSGTGGRFNVAIGRDALENITSAKYNVAIGVEALHSITTGYNNVAIGSCTLRAVSTGTRNLGLGYGAGFDYEHTDTVLIGYRAGYYSADAKLVAVGTEAGYGSAGADFSESVLLGYRAGYGVASGSLAGYSVAVGAYSMYDVTTGDNNTVIGYKAGEDITSGSSNVCIGYMAGSGQITTDSNELWIANTNTATPLIYGEFTNTLLRIEATNVELKGTAKCGATPALSLADGSITDTSGAISFGGENLSTTGTLGSGTITVADGGSINLQEDITFTGATTVNLIKFPDALADALSFKEGANSYLTFVTSNGAEKVTFGKIFDAITGSTIGNLTLADGSITDSSGTISFSNENLTTTGTLGAGAITGTSFIIGGNTLDTNEWANLDGLDQSLATTDAPTFATGVSIGNLTLANGSITDSGGAISFGNENLTTTGTLGAGATTVGGNLVINTGYLDARDNEDVTSYIGRTAIGYCGHSDYAYVGHRDQVSPTNYALLQCAAGNTYLNAATGRKLYFRINNVDEAILNATTFDLQSNNLTTTGTLGCGAITGTGNLNINNTLTSDGAALYLEAGVTGVCSTTIYNDTTAVAANMHITADYQIKRSTSARKYKKEIRSMELDSSLIYNLQPVSFNSKYENKNNQRFIGLIADEVEQHYPEIIIYNDKNEAEDYDTKMLITLLLDQIQNLNKRIRSLEKG